MKLSQLLEKADIPVMIDSNLRDQVFQKDLPIKLSKYSYVETHGLYSKESLLTKINEQISINKVKNTGKPHILVIEGFNQLPSGLQIDMVQTLTEISKEQNIKTVLSLTGETSLAAQARSFTYTQEMSEIYNPENKIKNLREKSVTNTSIKNTI